MHTYQTFNHMGLCGWYVWFWQQEADATLRKARALKAQRKEEYQKAHSSTNRSQEEQSNNASNKQLEKKRRLQGEALQKVSQEEANRENNPFVFKAVYFS